MLKILTGRSGSGKTTLIINEIIKRLNDDNDHKNLILFVPEQMSFQAEYEIGKRVKGKTFRKLQVFSFKRLAYRIFLEVGGLNKTFINDMTVNMVITKIIEENKTKFLIYNKLSKNYSFVQLVHDVLKEFKNYALMPEVIEKLLQEEKMDETLHKKLHDLLIIYRELIQVYGNSLIDNEDFYRQLAEKIKESAYLKNADVYIDGYHSYTNVELNVIYEMMKITSNMTVLFTMDNPLTVDMSKDDHLFNMPFKTLLKIKNFALENNIEINFTHLPNQLSPRFNNQEMLFLEQNYLNDVKYDKEVSSIKIIETENPTSEINTVARLIFNDVYQNKATYGDYVIYTNNPEVYYPLIENIFPLYNIPIFIDDNKLMLDHFLLNFIDATLEAIITNFRYEAMFRAIKTEVFMPIVYHDEKLTVNNYARMIKSYRNRIDLLENYCLSHGIVGSSWDKPYWEIDIHKKLGDRVTVKTDKEVALEKLLNETKDEICTPLLKFRDEFKKATCIKEQIKAIYQLLVDLQIEEKLEIYEKVRTKGTSLDIDLNEAKKHKQVYNHLIDLFDELVLVCGDYQVSYDEFVKILRTGFKTMKFAIVPPAIDQVMVGTLKRSRMAMMGHFDDPKTLGVKKAIVLGVNENQIPRTYSDTGLMTSKEREYLQSLDIELLPTPERAFLDEYFIIYNVLCSPSTELVLSYTLSNNEKKEAYRSEIIERILSKFPLLKIQTIYDFPSMDSDNLQYVTTVNMTAKMILHAVNLLRKGYEVNDIWKALYGHFKHTLAYSNKLLGVMYENIPMALDRDDIKKLYGDTIISSVSAVESYNHCPYAFFLDRGLLLKERDIQKIEAMDIGDLYHETMRSIAEELLKNNQALHDLAFTDIEKLVDKIVDDFSLRMGRKYFSQNKKNEYLLYKIKQSLLNSLRSMHYQSKYSKFNIVAVEEKFGSNAKRLFVEPMALSTGFTMQLKGIIDRIDASSINDEPYVRIIDYKSGDLDIDFTKIYHRLSLQLFTYLDVVLDNADKLFSKKAHPAGVLYYHIQNAEISALGEMTEEDLRQKYFEEYRMKGYTLGDKEVSSLFDSKLTSSSKSDIINVSYKKDGNFHSYSKILTLKEMEALRRFTRASIVSSMEELTSGKIDIKPVMYKNKSRCQVCKYHSVCKFDAKLRENSYQEINKSGDNQEIIDRIVSEFGGE